MAIYLGLFALEFFLVGMPENPMTIDQHHGKGILLGLFMMFVPWIYMGIRVAMVIPLIQVTLSSFKLNKHP